MEQNTDPKLPKFLIGLRQYHQKQHPDATPLVPLSELRRLPVGTFGRTWADFVETNHLTPFDYGLRRPQYHDGVHVLTGYGVDPLGEAQVQAFLLGAKWHPINLIFGLALSKKARRTIGKVQLRKALLSAYQRGRASTFNPDTWTPEKYWHLSLETVQKYFQISM
ncbi:hypothetical protein PCC7418_0939 [Halothece sp. PCC 7418]|uniref:Coq4 family protein n=1 Tax=Halothece sp. (strain PCC 7418) TaxID=65093 RepID=UPI0002A07A89|nr:Coq4 family protein [Halothece sp. PCC 7418]AFZ43148.1 hypothetical protein PCC7418_0939 [Halothece sp. PCC 7418]